MTSLKSKYIDNYANLIISLGDKLSCSISDDFFGVDEIRTESFIFYDLTQHQIGSNNID